MDQSINKSFLKRCNNFSEKGCICDQRMGHSSQPGSLLELIQ